MGNRRFLEWARKLHLAVSRLFVLNFLFALTSSFASELVHPDFTCEGIYHAAHSAHSTRLAHAHPRPVPVTRVVAELGVANGRKVMIYQANTHVLAELDPEVQKAVGIVQSRFDEIGYEVDLGAKLLTYDPAATSYLVMKSPIEGGASETSGLLMVWDGTKTELKTEKKYRGIHFRQSNQDIFEVGHMGLNPAEAASGGMRNFIAGLKKFFLMKYGSLDGIPADATMICEAISRGQSILYRRLGFEMVGTAGENGKVPMRMNVREFLRKNAP